MMGWNLKARLGRVAEAAAARVVKKCGVVSGAPDQRRIAALLGLHEDAGYARARSIERVRTIDQLSQCSPANSSPAALLGYVHEAALRFYDTLDWVALSLDELGLARPLLLEIGSNPFFLTLLMAERFPQLEHMGVNYFGAAVPAIEIAAIVDEKRRLKESRFLHADIERHDLEQAGRFDIALFCEVLEHLPYDPAWALCNIARRLKPGGHLILTTPNPARFENIIRLVEQRETFSDPISAHGIHGRHNREYSARELRDMLEGSGFRLLEAKSIDVFPENYSRDGEAGGYGAYHMLRAVLDGEAKLFRPGWLYRGFSPERLAQSESFASRTG